MSNSQDNPEVGGRVASPGQSVDRSPSRSLVLLPFRIVGSLTIGLILMSILILVLAWGTFVESEYGRSVANFILYGSGWFAALLGLFGLNIACATIARFPWKRYHFPFLAAHVGILVLLAGSYWTWRFGEEAQITLPEGSAGRLAVQTDRQRFELKTEFQATALPGLSRQENATTEISFDPGPFNWGDYDRSNWLNQGTKRYRDTVWLAMQFGDRDRGELPVGGGFKDVKFEVLDYLASSTTAPVPPLELSLLWKKMTRSKTELGELREHLRNWERIKLDINPAVRSERRENRGTRVEMRDGERVCYYMTTSQEEVDSFLTGLPEKKEGSDAASWGELVLFHDGQLYRIEMNLLLTETEGGKRFPLKGTVFEIGNVRFRAREPFLHLTLFTPDGQKETMTLIYDYPDRNVHAESLGVYGNLWIDPDAMAKAFTEQLDPEALERLGKPRIEIIQGPDKKLYYRYWALNAVLQSGVLPGFGEESENASSRKPTVQLAPETDEAVEMVVERFIPQDLPGLRIIPQPVGNDREMQRRAKLRVTVDGKEDTFWIRAEYPTVVPLPPERDQVRFVHGKGRTIRVQWKHGYVDLGFGVFLKKFEKRTEPGTRMPSHYSSLVDFVSMPKTEQGDGRSIDRQSVLSEDVLIQMNRPAVFKGPESRHSYRIYQASYGGPFHPDDFYRFHHFYDGRVFPWESQPRETLYTSTLSINNDPGRGLKYLGSFLLIFGTALFFFRKS